MLILGSVCTQNGWFLSEFGIHLGLLASEVSVGMPFDLTVHQFPQLSFGIHITNSAYLTGLL